jgi:penicillin-binding protein 1C
MGDDRSAAAWSLLAAVGSSRQRLVTSWLGLEVWRRVAIVVLVLLVAGEMADWLFPPPLGKQQEVSAVVVDRRGAILRVFPVKTGIWRMKATIDGIDPHFVIALLAYEDKRFRSHRGVDLVALVRAASSFVSTGHIVSGGSTLTMQTARLLEPRRRRIGSKLIESIRAWQLERRLSKEQILETYLTLAPYGGNIEGVRAASWAYFGREPDALSPDQIAMLIALPQSPEARRPDLHPQAAVVARARVLDRLAAKGIFAADLATESDSYPPPKRRPFPAMAWQASEEALARSRRWRADAKGNIGTTLDSPLQRELEDLAKRAAQMQQDGAQVAIMAVDIETREVRAAVGSADRSAPGGWLDLTNRTRSPGSTLKPFVYGLAFDDGVAAGGTRINDAPRRFATYRPEDFDRVFHGEVTVAEALQHSLNIPAVEALEAVGARRFAATLRFAGAELSLPLDAQDDVGLPMALGGVGLTLRDLVMLYAALGDGGRAKPLRWLPIESQLASKAIQKPTRIMSVDSARQIVKILGAAPPPAGRMPASLTEQAPDIAFKTGTSYGYRDAWAAGISGGYAVVVWSGRPDGVPRPGVTGRAAALPVLFEAFDAITRVTPASGFRFDVSLPSDSSDGPPPPLARFGRESASPRVLFPPDGAELWSDQEHRDFVLVAEGRGRLTWYVAGRPVDRNLTGESVWRPLGPGFYTLSVVDSEGRTTTTKVRVESAE